MPRGAVARGTRVRARAGRRSGWTALVGICVVWTLLCGAGVPAAPDRTVPARSTSDSARSALARTAPDSARTAPDLTVTFRGWAMDTCGAPSTGTLTRWRTSRYRALGIYFGGRGRACPQPRLTPGWVRAVDRMGWRLLPVYAGSQAPCVGGGVKPRVSIGKHPARQGAREGRDAVRRAHALGLLTGSALYLDVESYDRRNTSCARRVLSFVRAWDREVGTSGYLPGFYSSADTGVRHVEGARRAGVDNLPAVMWFARWRGTPRLYGEPALRRSAWQGRRIHQYAGNVRERHGGRSLLIDRNLVDAPVARIG
ncbi:DUF1906 domain-containing protein [Streptomyces sp. PG2]